MNSIGAFTDQMRANLFGRAQDDEAVNSRFGNRGFVPQVKNEFLGDQPQLQRGVDQISDTQKVLMKRLGERLGVEVEPDKALSPEDVASNVATFVVNRIDQAAKNGASQEKLQSMVEQAKEGVAKGFGEALETLEEMGRLDEDLEEEIAASRSLIDEALQSLEQKYSYLTPEKGDEPVYVRPNPIGEVESDEGPTEQIGLPGRLPTERPGVPNRGPTEQAGGPGWIPNGQPEVSGRGPTEQAGGPGNLAFRQSASYSLNESFSFEVTTQDGDKVTVTADYSFDTQGQYGFASNGNRSIEAASFSQSTSTGFSLSVDGELDEGELQAISELFSQVSEVSDEFYNGDFNTAFEMAMDLNMDSSELASFALDLKQTEVATSTTSYRQVGERPPAPAYVVDQMQEMGSKLRNALANAGDFGSSADLVKDLIQGQQNEQQLDQQAEELLPQKFDLLDKMVGLLENSRLS